MEASPTAADLSTLPSQDKWLTSDDRIPDHLGAVGDGDREREPSNGLPLHGGEPLPPPESADDYRSEDSAGKSYREKQVKPNKVYIGGLPEHTRQEDLRNCFGKIGNIVNIELKLGYGFVEFDSKEAAEESVAKYHEGFFMGNKIRVELSHGGGRTAKYTGDPGACFKCGQMGHWARECPNQAVQGAPGRKSGHHGGHYQDSGREYPPPPPRDYPPYRDDYGRYPPVRDARYGYEYPPPPPPRDYRRPVSPPRDYRDYGGAPRPPRDYDDYRMRGAAPVPPSRGYYPPDGPPGYPPRSYDGPPRDLDRPSDRRAVPPADRFPPYPPAGRPRTPTGPPPAAARPREFEDRGPPRDYTPSEYRGRPTTPPLPPPSGRYGEYPPRNGAAEPPANRYRRRSQSPPPRTGGTNYRATGYANDRVPDAAPYPPSNAPYGSPAGAYSGNGYTPGSSGPPSRAGGGPRDRNYPPRDVPDPGYSRRA